MSDKEETPKETQEPEAASDPAPSAEDELEIVDAMKPSPAPSSNNKPLRYGNRRKRAGEKAPAVTTLGAIDSLDEEEIEMDDLPVKATAPEDLIDKRPNPSGSRDDSGDDRPRRSDRPRGERRERKPRERAPEAETESEPVSAEAQPQTDDATDESDQSENRPERFGMVSEAETRARHQAQVQEFRPSRDGRVAPKRETKRERPTRSGPAPVKKKGIFSKIISLFTGDDQPEEPRQKEQEEASDRSGQRRRGGRGRRGPDARQDRGDGQDGEGGPNRRRRRRPRNRKPRNPDGSGDSQPRGEGGNGNRRRRRRRPRGQGQGQDKRQGQPSSSNE